MQGFASGLGAVGVALVAGAAIQLSAKTSPDRETQFINLLAAVHTHTHTHIATAARRNKPYRLNPLNPRD
jgi:hypothetical protein